MSVCDVSVCIGLCMYLVITKSFYIDTIHTFIVRSVIEPSDPTTGALKGEEGTVAASLDDQ